MLCTFNLLTFFPLLSFSCVSFYDFFLHSSSKFPHLAFLILVLSSRFVIMSIYEHPLLLFVISLSSTSQHTFLLSLHQRHPLLLSLPFYNSHSWYLFTFMILVCLHPVPRLRSAFLPCRQLLYFYFIFIAIICLFPPPRPFPLHSCSFFLQRC